MKQILNEWRKCLSETLEHIDNPEDDNYLSPKQLEYPERYGNCGILSVALIEEGLDRQIDGIEITFVTAEDEYDFLEADEPEIHHVVMWYNGKYYDDRGEVTRSQLGAFSPLGFTSPRGAQAEEGRDYLVLSYKISNKEELSYALGIVKNNTDWWKTCDEYKERAQEFWDNIK